MATAIGGVVMKDRQLFKRSMLLVLIPIFILSLVLILMSQVVIKNYFRDDSFQILDRELTELSEVMADKPTGRLDPAKNLLMQNIQSRQDQKLPVDPLKSSKTPRSNIIVEESPGNYKVLGAVNTFVEEQLDDLKTNLVWPLHGEVTIDDDSIFYAIQPIDENTNRIRESDLKYENLYYITYISESYSSGLTQTVIGVFSIGLGVLIILTSAILFVVFRKITTRLSKLESGTQAIGQGEFHTLIPSTPDDEIGRLGDAMNRMGKQLALIQEEQADNLQTISHELKTPIMVIQGYMDALVHGQYPSGSKEATYDIIISELVKLETLTKDLIKLNKADYMARNNVSMKKLELSRLFGQVVSRLDNSSDIVISIKGQHIITADEASWIRIIENIMTNHMRYAKSKININLSDVISIKNDGETIDPHLLSKIKKPFVKGITGKSGLGLTIISNTLKLYHYKLEVVNRDDGVEYLIIKT
jgi:signal transduction histidine kinase